MDLDGGAATAFGPAVAVEPGGEYFVEGYVKTSALQHDAAWMSLTFTDAARARLADAVSEKIDGTNPWRKVRVGPLSPPAGASTLYVGVHLAPQGADQDLHGSAFFGSLWVGRLPRVALAARRIDAANGQNVHEAGIATTNNLKLRGAGDASFLVFARQPQAGTGREGKPQTGSGAIEIACLVSGFAAPRYEVRLELADCEGRTIARHCQSVSNSGLPALKTTGTDATGKTPKSRTEGAARTAWQIPGDSAGYYRVSAELVPLGEDGASYGQPIARTSLGIAIIDMHPPPQESEFGWSLDTDDVAVGLVPLGDLLAQSGARRVKYPFVCAPSPRKGDRIEPLISFSDRLSRAGVQLAGVLHPPTGNDQATAEKGAAPFSQPSAIPEFGPSQPRESGQSPGILAVEAFGLDPKTWYPSIKPVLARLGTEIRCWQIGDDRDTGWTGFSDLPAVVSPVKAELDKVGQDVDVGIAWDIRRRCRWRALV